MANGQSQSLRSDRGGHRAIQLPEHGTCLLDDLRPRLRYAEKSAFQQRQKRNGDSAVKLLQVQSLCKRGNGKCEAQNEIYGNETFCRRQHGWTCLVLAWHGYRQNIASIDKKMATAKGHQETENGTPVSLAVWSLNWSFRVRFCRHAQKVPRLTKRSPHEGLM